MIESDVSINVAFLGQLSDGDILSTKVLLQLLFWQSFLFVPLLKTQEVTFIKYSENDDFCLNDDQNDLEKFIDIFTYYTFIDSHKTFYLLICKICSS